MTKSTKSQQGGLTPSSFRTSCGVHELAARSSAWRVRATQDSAKVGSLATLYNFIYTTRANTAHEKAEQIRARIVCTPAESAWRGLTHMRSMCVGVAETGHRGSSTRADGSKDFCQPSPVGEGGARSVTDEVSFVKKT